MAAYQTQPAKRQHTHLSNGNLPHLPKGSLPHLSKDSHTTHLQETESKENQETANYSKKIITDNNMTVANLKADAGIWTRVNRKKSEEKSVIDYILASPYIAKAIQTLIVDEEGHLRVKGKNETDHNTITTTIK